MINSISDIKKLKRRYQEIILPNGSVIKKKSSKTIQDSRKKITKLFDDIDFSGKTYLDIGCAEGFFLREAISRGAKSAEGVDIENIRIEVNSFINNLWGYSEKIKVINGDFRNITEQYDIVSCIAVLHHYQRTSDGVKFLDTWNMISDRRYEFVLKKHIEMMKFIASLTKEITIIEYPYTYKWYETKREDIDFELLARLWEKEGIYEKVEFRGFVQKSKVKDRAVYYAYKKKNSSTEKNIFKDRLPINQYLLEEYECTRDDKGTTFSVSKNKFEKKYNLNPNRITKKEQEKRFLNELNTYKYLEEIGWKNSPKLLDYSEKEKSLTIERFRYKSLHEYLSNNFFLNFSWLFKNLKKLDKELIKSKINCRGITNKDVLVGDGKLWLIDFEETTIRSDYSESLPLQLVKDLNKRFNTFYKYNKQKNIYKRMLRVWSIKKIINKIIKKNG